VSAPAQARAALAELQQLLQSLHGVEAAPVGQFLISAEERERLAPAASPDEALLLQGRVDLAEPGAGPGAGLGVGLFLSDEVLFQLARTSAEPWSQARLAGFCAAAEGVSHFLYLAHRAARDQPVSMLELEAQGELDKYLCVVLQLWAVGRRAASAELRRRLFSLWEPREGISAQEEERYRLASRLAAAAARMLEARFVLAGRLEGLLREARRLYRLAGGEKFAAFATG
jgi:hypothetical protein